LLEDVKVGAAMPGPQPDAAAHSALAFTRDAYETAGPQLMGRHSANEGLLLGLAQAGTEAGRALDIYCFHPRAAAELPGYAETLGLAGRYSLIRPEDLQGLARSGCVTMPGPEIPPMARRRALLGDGAFSIVGITHTTSSQAAAELITDLVGGRAQPWDALVCTSEAVRSTVRHLVEAEQEALRRRLGATRFPVPQFPVIPLGVHADAFRLSPETRAAWRARLGIAEDALAVLSLGRLSWHAKAHPLPMFLALGHAARGLGKPVHLILAGWFAGPEIERTYRTLAAALCPNVTLHVLDGRLPEVRREIWAAADLFTLLSDNIQETFGLAPIEAMAAGLPCVISDWNGLRETVRHGIDGLLVPTVTAPPGTGMDMAWAHACSAYDYDAFIGLQAQGNAVAVGAATEAYRSLLADPERRRGMAEAARRRARETFDWAVVIRQYRTLWAELAARRAAEATPEFVPEPRFADPTRAFGHYGTAALSVDDRVELLPGTGPAEVMARLGLPGLVIGLPTGARPQVIQEVAQRLLSSQGRARAGALLGGPGTPGRLERLRAILWLCKAGLARLKPPG
jgi:glycosyltransferase involved in cell wall biosynthesis